MKSRTCKFYFKHLCLVTVVFMVGYWFYKYEIEDRDIGVVDYVSMSEAHNFELPIATLCIKNPFLANLSSDGNSKADFEKYLEYLQGDYWEDSFTTIQYENATVNLNDYFVYGAEKWNNESQWRKSSLKFRHQNVFNGFYLSDFLKCFSIESEISKKLYIKKIRLYYNINELFQKYGKSKFSLYYKINYPGQFLLGETPYQLKKSFNSTSKHRFIRIKKIEILKRRNTRNKKCSESSLKYDEMVLNKHVEKFGCNLPYVKKQKGYSTCHTKEKIKNARFEYETTKTMGYPKDCQRMSEIRKQSTSDKRSKTSKLWRFGISYPEEIKIITNSQEVDIHSLIGNIGGYVGLFLGNFN